MIPALICAPRCHSPFIRKRDLWAGNGWKSGGNDEWISEGVRQSRIYLSRSSPGFEPVIWPSRTRWARDLFLSVSLTFWLVARDPIFSFGVRLREAINREVDAVIILWRHYGLSSKKNFIGRFYSMFRNVVLVGECLDQRQCSESMCSLYTRVVQI